MNRLQTRHIASIQKKPSGLAIVSLTLLTLIGIPGLLFVYRGYLQQRVKTALESTPELATYPLQPDVDWGGVKLMGRLPHARLREKATEVTYAILPELAIQNRIEVVAVPINPTIVASEVKRVTQVLNQAPGNAIAATYKAETVALRGSVATERTMSAIAEAYRRIPGVKSVASTLQVRSKQLQLVFPSRAATLDTRQQLQLKAFIQRHAKKRFRIAVDRNQSGSAITVQQALVQAGVSRDRIQVQTVRNNTTHSRTAVLIKIN